MSSMMRKRGWSIHSEGEHSHGTKQSIMTEQSEETLTDAEKLKLFQNFPTDESENHNKNENEEDVIDMFGSDDEASDRRSSTDNYVSHKRRKLGNSKVDATTVGKESVSTGDCGAPISEEDTDQRKKLLETAKGRLSKWAARLFDPDRSRGLVEAPQVIPLNDEFLKAFGKREKEFDDKTGRIFEIDKSNLDEITDDENDEINIVGNKDSTQLPSGSDVHCKVKIVNLAYNTSKARIMKTFQKYGVLLKIDLVANPDNPKLSLGRGSVTYESRVGAKECVEKMNEQCLDGRVIRVFLYNSKPRRSLDTPAKRASTTRYWVKDISTKCFRCGEVGHIEINCTNEAKPKPCPLCGKFDHGSIPCPVFMICFNCGVPGHSNRECAHRRGLPKRMVCGLCFKSGHHRWACKENLSNIPTHDAKCLVCGKIGHFMCKPMRWFFGLKGTSCYNCGRSGHHGMSCDRPNIEACNNNSELALQEIERAQAFSLADEVSIQESKRSRKSDEQDKTMQRRNNRHDEHNRDRARSKSLPPPNGGFRSPNIKSTYGKIQSHRTFGRDNHKNGNERSSSSSQHGYHDNTNKQSQNRTGNVGRGYQDNFNDRSSRKRNR